ncbi:MAG TPA: flagellar basal-body rod protein FlgF [Bryobacteraceae bacterium]|nr:flagellar basal-body rod protein FlgF [Bryobacteraceae bacterium]
MDPLTISAAAGLQSRMDSLDLLANNIANQSTGGFKADRESYSLYVAPETAGSVPDADALPVVERLWTDFSQGELRPTGNPLDLAVAGKGFFAVSTSSGPLYTRDGSFRLSASGQLVTADGYAVRAVGGEPLTLSAAAPVDVSPDGTVRQNGQTAGKLEIVDFPSPAALARQAHSYFRLTEANAQPVRASGYQVHQGNLENSNDSGARAAVRLVTVMRQFEMLQKAITLGTEMNQKALDEVAKV